MRNYLQDTQRVLADQLGLDESEITPDKDLYQDLHADSLDTVELLMAFEDEYDIDIDDADAEKCKKVSDIVAYLEERFSPANVPAMGAADTNTPTKEPTR